MGCSSVNIGVGIALLDGVIARAWVQIPFMSISFVFTLNKKRNERVGFRL